MLLPLLLLTVPLRIVEHAPVAEQVYVNGQGPFRFLIDTGAEGTIVHPAVAARLGLRPEFRTEIVTLAGAEWRAGARLRSVALGALAVESVDAVLDPLPAVRSVDPLVDGVLGQDVLGRANYLIDYGGRRLVFDPVVRGDRVHLRWVEGRPAVDVRAEGRTLRLILDSGVGRVVLFHAVGGRGVLRVGTNTGARIGGLRQLARLSVGRSAWVGVEAALVASPGREADGLFPLQLAGAVYVNNREGYVIFNPY